MSQTKDARLQLIRSLLTAQEVRSQEDLQTSLTQAGYAVTQSSVSRDLADLGVQKQRGRYMLPTPPQSQELGLVSLKPAGPNLLVLRTAIGAAQLVAVRLDNLGRSEIVGTVAGDDTIFVATATAADQASLMSALGATA
ncbi:MAG: hypothetical protein JNJ45_02265 [Chthonomonas sp.]|nr:hypothetical protein [Chthonomonas sp.]